LLLVLLGCIREWLAAGTMSFWECTSTRLRASLVRYALRFWASARYTAHSTPSTIKPPAAVFAQNAVFTRALGVSRLVQLVGDDRTSSWLFGMQQRITQMLVTPFAWYAGSRITPLANRAQLRPLVYIASIAVVCVLEHAVLWLAKGLPHRSALLRIVPLAGLNSCVLGTVLVERTQSFTLGQSLGFVRR